MVYDIAIIGAGVNGCALNYYLQQHNKSVALIDSRGIASGGSGAAGAFISPKISKGGELKSLMDEAFQYSLDFYSANFSKYTTEKSLLHLNRRDSEKSKVESFARSTKLKLSDTTEEMLSYLTSSAKQSSYVALKRAAVVDAKGVCQQMALGADFLKSEISSLKRTDEYWQVGSIKAKHVVLTTGASAHIVKMPHIQLRAVWGHRIDIKTATNLPFHLHQHVSISSTNSDNICAIGATHDLNFRYENLNSSTAQARSELLQKASLSIELKDVEIVAEFGGYRSGSNDYLPMMGRVVDSSATIDKFQDLSQIKKVKFDSFIYHKNLYMQNGVGGYGFVLAPLLAKRLSAMILNNIDEDKTLSASRFLSRYIKRGRA